MRSDTCQCGSADETVRIHNSAITRGRAGDEVGTDRSTGPVPPRADCCPQNGVQGPRTSRTRAGIARGCRPPGRQRVRQKGAGAMEMTRMRAEIDEQPAALRRTIDALLPRIAEIGLLARETRQVLFVARGSSDNAAVY